eukprot:CAMPEP_0169077992 /NCGR_PEP_ID=MMETSP1015-20121227/9175_1 /TAXON_ID=342587 /ORGANISM="Karlodinium micrum, Strain CCMP2283" /LENGTH=67 /DNA_ID=CAMNT_0009137555 /DNA_START=700 /DNA_END=903 /DNA_ORIENTATION=-
MPVGCVGLSGVRWPKSNIIPITESYMQQIATEDAERTISRDINAFGGYEGLNFHGRKVSLNRLYQMM